MKAYGIVRCDDTSPYASGTGRSYVVTHCGHLVGHVEVHANGYLDWAIRAGAKYPSASTQRRLAQSVRNDRNGGNK